MHRLHAAPRWVSILSPLAAIGFAVTAHWQAAGAATTQGTIQGFQFQLPASVQAGDTITWTNKDSAPHTVTSDTAGVFDVSVAAGATADLKAPAAGSYAFHCNVHPNMKATLVVAATGAAPAAPAAPAAGNTATSASEGTSNLLIAAAVAAIALAAASGALALRQR